MGNNDDRVIQTDNWTRYIWRHHLEPANDVKAALQRGAAKFETFPGFSREVFGRLFTGKERRVEDIRPEDAWQARAHDELGELPGWAPLVRRARGDRLLAGTAATAFAEKVLAELPAPAERLLDVEALRKRVRVLLRMVSDGIGHSTELDDLLTQTRERGRAAVAAAQGYALALDEGVLRDALRAGIVAAQASVDELEGQLAGFAGWGTSEVRGDVTELALLAERLRQDEKMRRLGVAAGRMRRIAMLKRRTRSKHARDEVSDIERGNDLSRVLPSELVKLTDPLLALDFARAFMEGTLAQYRLHGRERLGRGPVVVCLDSSGSMEGEREVWSKAVALALLQLAVADKRRCRVVQFDDDVRRVDDFAPGKLDGRAAMDAMVPFFGGGTNFEKPLTTALEAIEREADLKAADVVLISDGEAEVSERFRSKWAAARRKHEVTVFAVAIGGTTSPTLVEVADHVLRVNDLGDDDSIGDALFARVA